MTKTDFKRMRCDLELTQKHIAEEIGITQSLISHFECGRVSLDSPAGRAYKQYVSNRFIRKYPIATLGLVALSEVKGAFIGNYK